MQVDVGVLLTRLATLEDPVRRALYFHVARRGGDTSRDQAARAVGVSRGLAAFHLDRLVHVGLLQVSYRRLNRRRGPGAGRPSKLYRRAGIQLSLSLPPRDYELAAELFAAAFTGSRARQQLDRVARRVGRRLAALAHTKGRRAFVSMLARHGYQPSTAAGGSIVLRNCPFDALARTHRDVMCGANRALVEGVRRGAGLAGYEVVATSEPGRCCATIRPR